MTGRRDRGMMTRESGSERGMRGVVEGARRREMKEHQNGGGGAEQIDKGYFNYFN